MTQSAAPCSAAVSERGESSVFSHSLRVSVLQGAPPSTLAHDFDAHRSLTVATVYPQYMNASTNQRIILLTPSLTYRATAFLEAAARLDLEVVRGLDMPSPLAKYWHPTLPLDFRAPDRAVRDLVRYARANPARAILSVDDAATVIAARACEALGLSHN
ncbi:MAG: hypothetical protein ACRDGS_12100, partial [Chloroflexota bacterium]